ncbi:hypothetical protein, partial [Microbispora hainanensis]|uniref:hypothetical protein n=1 Tax=Microbispora hainanensis TaxID=568844 RepID=UPI0033C272C2
MVALGSGGVRGAARLALPRPPLTGPALTGSPATRLLIAKSGRDVAGASGRVGGGDSLSSVELVRGLGAVGAALSTRIAHHVGDGVVGLAGVVGASGGVGGVGVGVVGALGTGICPGLAGSRVARVVPAFLEAPGVGEVVAGGAVAEVCEVVADVV